jgi:hypothetical protein
MIKVKLDEIEIDVKKLPIGDYVDLIKSVKKLPQHIVKLDNLSSDKIVAIIPDLIGESLPDLLEVLAVAVKMPIDKITPLGLHEIIRLIEAFFKVNKYDEIGEVIKKALAHPTIAKYLQKAQANQATK